MNSLKIGVAQLPALLPSDWANSPTAAVVIDTLRFTSTACVALDAGARSIQVMSHIDAARQLASTTATPCCCAANGIVSKSLVLI